MPNRPQRPNGPKLVMIPLSTPSTETPPIIKDAVIEYAAHLDITKTEEDIDWVHPLTKFRAAMWKLFNNPTVADGMIHTLEDCGLGLYAYAVSESEPTIIKP